MNNSSGTVEAVIFDVDGTLVDSERDGHRIAFNAAFEEFGLPDRWDVSTYGELLAVTGGAHRLTHWFVSRGMPPGEARDLAIPLHRRKTELMTALVADGRIAARPGALDLIDQLRQCGVWAHVATTGSRAWVAPLLYNTFGDRFDVVVTGTEVARLKPDPAAYLEVLRLTGARPDHTVAIEDSANGCRAATAAGLRCVVTRNQYTRCEDFTGADLVVDELSDRTVWEWFGPRVTGPGGVHA